VGSCWYHVESLLWALLSWTEQQRASIQHPSIQIRANNKERRDVCSYDFFSQPGLMGSKVQWYTPVHDKENGYKRPSFHRRSLLPSIVSTIRLLHSKWANELMIRLQTSCRSHTMSTNGSPPKTCTLAPTGWPVSGSQQRPEDNVGASDNNAGNTPSKVSQLR